MGTNKQGVIKGKCWLFAKTNKNDKLCARVIRKENGSQVNDISIRKEMKLNIQQPLKYMRLVLLISSQ